MYNRGLLYCQIGLRRCNELHQCIDRLQVWPKISHSYRSCFIAVSVTEGRSVIFVIAARISTSLNE